MKRYFQQVGGAKVMIEELQTAADPKPSPMNSGYLLANGFEPSGHNTYSRGDVSIKYDGCYWECFYFCAAFRIETIEQFEKLIS